MLTTNFAIISFELKKIARPPRKNRADKSFVNRKEDQSIILTLEANFIIQSTSKMRVFFQVFLTC